MTLVYKDSFDKIKKPLEKDNINIKHILLESTYDIVRKRIISRGESEDSWCIKNINLCLKNQREFKDVIRIKSTKKTIDELVNEFQKFK